MERKFKYSINEEIINKGKPTAKGWINRHTSVDEFINYVRQGVAHSQAVIRKEKEGGVKPSKNDVLYAEMLLIDIDNDIIYNGSKRCKTPEEGYFSFQDALADPWVREFALFAYTSASYTEDWHRFRIVFALPDQFKESEYEALAKKLIAHYGADKSASNIDRIWFGNDGAQVEVIGGTLTREAINTFCREEEEVKKVEKEHQKHNNNSEITPDQAKEMLSFIPSSGLDNKFYFKMIQAVAGHFDRNTAINLIDGWAPDTIQGTPYKVDQVIRRGTTIGISTLIWGAQQYGFVQSTLYEGSNGVERSKPKLSKKQQVDENGTLVEVTPVKGGKGKNGMSKKAINIRLMREYLGERYEFRKDIVRKRMEIKKLEEENPEFKDIEDDDEDEIWTDMAESGIEVDMKTFLSYLNGKSPKFDPLKHYFYNLPEWDGVTDYIGRYVDLVKVDPSEERMWRWYFHVWITAVVATSCAMDINNRPFVNQQTIVFQGKQSAGKTTICEMLVPKALSKFYANSYIDKDKKDSQTLLFEKFLVILDEIEGSTNKDANHLKAQMTIKDVTHRKVWGRNTDNIRRRASFIGTVNSRRFLNDPTGDRRYLVVGAKEIHFEKFYDLIDIDQLYAQAFFLLKEGIVKPYISKDETKKILEANSSYTAPMSEEEMLNAYFEPYDQKDKSSTQMNTDIEAKKLMVLSQTEILSFLNSKLDGVKLNSKKLGEALDKARFEVSRPRKFGRREVYFCEVKSHNQYIDYEEKTEAQF